MQKECIEVGRTVDAAIDAACEKLGMTREQVQFEILDLPKKGFLGLKTIPARVRVYVEETKAEYACEFVRSVLAQMDVSPEISVEQDEEGIHITLQGEGLGFIIGRRGETLDSLQYLTGLVANRLEGEYVRVTIDSGNYRDKREKTLESLAHKIAVNAVKTGRSSTLEPMNPYERRIIHAAVSRVKGATSSSIGEEPNRRVVIKPTVPPEGGSKSGERRSRGGRSRGGRGGRDRDRRGDRRDRGPRPPKGDRAPEERVDRAPRNLDDYPIPPREELPQEEPKPAPAAPRVDKPLEESELGGVLYGKIEL